MSMHTSMYANNSADVTENNYTLVSSTAICTIHVYVKVYLTVTFGAATKNYSKKCVNYNSPIQNFFLTTIMQGMTTIQGNNAFLRKYFKVLHKSAQCNYFMLAVPSTSAL